jgi:DNA-binding phage protein
MDNPFWSMIRLGDEPVYKIAGKVKMSRNTIVKIMSKDGIPRQARIETLDRLASHFGYRVKVTLERVNGE